MMAGIVEQAGRAKRQLRWPCIVHREIKMKIIKRREKVLSAWLAFGAAINTHQ